MTEPPDSASRRSALLGLTLTLLAAGLWAWLAPPERSLGERIRLVYLHVSVTWAGLLFIYGTAVAGLARAAGFVSALEPWLRRTWSAGVTLFTLGFALSLVAAKVSWGGIFWGEPRVRASLGAIGVAVLALAVESAFGSVRFRGLVWPTAAALLSAVLAGSALVLHPEDPIQDVTPWGIRLTFYGLTLLMLAAGASLAVALPGRGGGRDPGGGPAPTPR